MVRPSLDKIVREFKTLVRGVVNAGSDDLAHFKLALARRNASNGVGILGPVSSPSFNVSVDTLEGDGIAKPLVTLSRQVIAKDVDDDIGSKRKLVPKVLAPNGKVDWDSFITTFSHALTTLTGTQCLLAVAKQVV